MAAFDSPLANPDQWIFTATTETVPTGLRFAGMTLPAIHAAPTGANLGPSVQAPARGLLHALATTGPARIWIEIHVNPVWFRPKIALLPALPTFYLVFDDPALARITAGTEAVATVADPPGVGNAGWMQLGVGAVTLLVAGDDWVARDPRFWIRAIAGFGGDGFAAFAAALEVAQPAEGEPGFTGEVPVYALDQAGRLLAGQEVWLRSPSLPGGEAALTLGADANVAAAYNAGSLWSLDSPLVSLRPAAEDTGQRQAASGEDGGAAADAAAVDGDHRHVLLTDLHDWFAPQGAASLVRFTRGNNVGTYVGREFFEDWFRRAARALRAGGGVHLVGWDMDAVAELATRRPGEDDLPRSLKELAALATGGTGGGQARFLVSDRYEFNLGAQPWVLSTLAVVLGLLDLAGAAGLEALKADASGILLASAVAAYYILAKLVTNDFYHESNKNARDALNGPTGAPGSIAALSAYPARLLDNPLRHDSPLAQLLQYVSGVGVFHQKLSLIQDPSLAAPDDIVAFCGGMDFNPNRLDNWIHVARAPFHDVHAIVSGPAARDLALTFEERWTRDGSGGLAFPTPADPPAAGPHIVQVARTYFEPRPGGAALPFAPDGDRTLVNTMIRALQSARQFVYIEEQYLTPTTGGSQLAGSEYLDALVAAAQRVERTIIVVTGQGDQLFNEGRRSAVVGRLLRDAPGKVLIGFPRRKPTLTSSPIRSGAGRLILSADVDEREGEDSIVVEPKSRVPAFPFWLVCEGELMWATGVDSPAPADGQLRLHVVRGNTTRVARRDGVEANPKPREHKGGAPVTVTELAQIYVHAKLTIIDDVYLAIGSCNLNRRGFYHDGELDIFIVPEALRADRGNPVRDLRVRLWGEHLDLPSRVWGPLLSDPIAAARLFDRSPLLGNRFVPLDAQMEPAMIKAITSDSIMTELVGVFGFELITIEAGDMWNLVVDPTSDLEPLPEGEP